jgi:hypothetical protein
MPLHDWSSNTAWDNFRAHWIRRFFYDIKPRLPNDYRAFLGSAGGLSVAPKERPDVGVRQWRPEPELPAASPNGAAAGSQEPDEEVATLTLEPEQALYVAYQGRLVAGIELVSPRNKDRPSAREHYLARYLGYLREGAHVLLVDVHRRPLTFSFADQMAQELQIKQAPFPAPQAVSYRVGEPAASGGRLLGIWRRALTVGQPLPVLPLPLTTQTALDIDLEKTYTLAATDSYM